MPTITEEQAKNLIIGSSGQIFTVRFIKKNGDERVLTGRTGVKRYVTGTGRSYDPLTKNLVSVYELNRDTKGPENYRFIPLDRLLEVRIGGETYKVES